MEREIERLYGSTKISELYKNDPLVREEEICEEEVEYKVLNGEVVKYPLGKMKCEKQVVEERWSDIITQKEHILTQFIINKYKCNRIEEIPLTVWEGFGNLVLVNRESDIYEQLEWIEAIYNIRPATLSVHRVAPGPLIYFITLKSTYRDDKILACVI